jgi:hypothetical protein
MEQIPGFKRDGRKISFGRIDEKRLNEVLGYRYVSVPETKVKEQIEEEEDPDSTTKKPAANEPVLWNAPKVRKDIPGIA